MHLIIANTLLIISLLMQYTVKIETETQQITADLDGDGVEELITLEYMPDTGDYILTDGIANIEGWLEPWLLGMELVDIDESDNQMEIAVQTAGPSDDYEADYYTLINDRIQFIGHVYGYATSHGGGDVISEVWMGFWSRLDIYRLNRANIMLERVDQDLYSVIGYVDGRQPGIECSVLESFPLYAYQDGQEILTNLEAGDDITIVACHVADRSASDDIELAIGHFDWYLIMDEEGITGWAQFGDIWDKLDGIMWAD